MNQTFTSLGLMSGTSGDGVDASIIQSDGDTKYKEIKDKYFEYDREIYQNIHDLKDKIHNFTDIKKLNKELSDLERQITLFHAKVVKEISKNQKIDIIGFHGQTIYHNPQEKISTQLGDGKLLSQLTKKDIVYSFRQNDIKNGGEGAPLASIFHQLLATQLKLNLPDIVYVYSQNSASNFLKLIKIYKTENLWMNTNLMCIGEKTSLILNEIKWKKIFLFNPGEEEFLLYKI